MVGYPESLTDPSYAGQILVLTYPLVGSYGVPARPNQGASLDEIPADFESSKIHVAGLVVTNYSGQQDDFSHFNAQSELAQWLKDEGVPAIFGVDTRALTKKIRELGSMTGRLARHTGAAAVPSPARWRDAYEQLEYHDSNGENLVARVSRDTPHVFRPNKDVEPVMLDGRPARVLCVDVGMKFNQLRCFLKRGVEVKVVPWDYDYLAAGEEPFDGLFLSNGPGDPAVMTATSDRIAQAMALEKFPVFGICLGHQLLARASGAQTLKLKYGNRGANLPCTSLISGRCYITSQNHGYAVDAASLQGAWQELFVNANDGSNEGIWHTQLPFFSVQFHPESAPGPRDTEFLFDVFIDAIVRSSKAGKLSGPVILPGGTVAEAVEKSPRVTPRKVLVLGSGGLSIGQAGEFDYSGSQAIKALKEEGIYTILINPNIATIQTSKGCALFPRPERSTQANSVAASRTRSTSCLSRPSSCARSSSTSARTASTSPLAARPPSKSASSSRTSLRASASRCSAPRSTPSSRPRTATCSRRPWPRLAKSARRAPRPRRSTTPSRRPTRSATLSSCAPRSRSVAWARASPTTRTSSASSAQRRSPPARRCSSRRA